MAAKGPEDEQSKPPFDSKTAEERILELLHDCETNVKSGTANKNDFDNARISHGQFLVAGDQIIKLKTKVQTEDVKKEIAKLEDKQKMCLLFIEETTSIIKKPEAKQPDAVKKQEPENRQSWASWGFGIAKAAYNALPDMSNDPREKRREELSKMKASAKSEKTVRRQDQDDEDARILGNRTKNKNK